MDLSTLSQAKLNGIARQLNERPRKTLDFALMKFHRALPRRKYQRLFTAAHRNKPGPNGPSEEMIAAIVEIKQRNPRFDVMIDESFNVRVLSWFSLVDKLHFNVMIFSPLTGCEAKKGIFAVGFHTFP